MKGNGHLLVKDEIFVLNKTHVVDTTRRFWSGYYQEGHGILMCAECSAGIPKHVFANKKIKNCPPWTHLLLSPDHIFRARWKNGSGQLPFPFSFKCAETRVHCSLLILMSLKIAFRIACQQSTSERYVDRATLAAAYRLAFSIFRNKHELAVSEFVVY